MIEDTPSSITGRPVAADLKGLTLEIDVERADLWPDSQHKIVLIEDAVAATLSHEQITPNDLELSILLTGDTEIQALNAAHRGKDKPTNVLSFPGLDAEELNQLHSGSLRSNLGNGIPVMIGDIALARETIAREAREQHKSFDVHFSHLVVHGFLHLLGYDHMTDSEADIMEDKERSILANLGITDPYEMDMMDEAATVTGIQNG